MKKKISIFLLMISTSVFSAVSVETMIGKTEVLKDIKEEPKEVSSSSGGSCACSGIINSTQKNIESMVKDYVDSNIDALVKLRKQVVLNKRELGNRTNKIENNDYYELLNRKLKLVNNSGEFKKVNNYKLLGYENLLTFSKNGLAEKEMKLIQLYETIDSLDDIETSIITNKGIENEK